MTENDETSQDSDLDAAELSKVTVPRFSPPDEIYDFENNIMDYESIELVSKSINDARLALFKITNEINEYERLTAKSKLAYDRAYRRYYLTSAHVKPDSARRMRASLKCESLEDKCIVYEQLKNELNRTANAIRLELSALQAVGNNVRTQIRVS